MLVTPRLTLFFQLANVAHSFFSQRFERSLIALPSKATGRSISIVIDQKNKYDPKRGSQGLQRRLCQSTLSQQIAEGYSRRQTDGILELDIHTQKHYHAKELWEAVVEASKSKPGVAASIVNALIASCPSVNLALDLYDVSCCQPDTPFQIRPDLITYLVLADIHNEHNEQEAAEEFLDLARRFSEKNTAGGRKERAAARRKTRFSSLQEAEETLRKLMGPEFTVLFENESFAVVNKPSGISCTAQPGKKQAVDLPKAIIQTVEVISSINRALVHRLDKETSGCLILPKTDASHAMFARKFFLRSVNKTYLCIVTSAPAHERGWIHTPVESRPAESKYDLIHRFEDGSAMLEVATFTGRKHQVRVHCAQGLKCPILGDDIYGVSSSSEKPLHLHANSVSFHDNNNDRVLVEAPLPNFWPKIER